MDGLVAGFSPHSIWHRLYTAVSGLLLWNHNTQFSSCLCAGFLCCDCSARSGKWCKQQNSRLKLWVVVYNFKIVVKKFGHYSVRFYGGLNAVEIRSCCNSLVATRNFHLTNIDIDTNYWVGSYKALFPAEIFGYCGEGIAVNTVYLQL